MKKKVHSLPLLKNQIQHFIWLEKYTFHQQPVETSFDFYTSLGKKNIFHHFPPKQISRTASIKIVNALN